MSMMGNSQITFLDNEPKHQLSSLNLNSTSDIGFNKLNKKHYLV